MAITAGNLEHAEVRWDGVVVGSISYYPTTQRIMRKNYVAALYTYSCSPLEWAQRKAGNRFEKQYAHHSRTVGKNKTIRLLCDHGLSRKQYSSSLPIQRRGLHPEGIVCKPVTR
jgi:hypothetical protein